MVETLFNGGMVNLRRLLLADNCISTAGVRTPYMMAQIAPLPPS